MVHYHQDRVEEKNKGDAETKTRIDLPPEILSESQTSSAQQKRVEDDEENSHNEEVLVASVEVRALRRIHCDSLSVHIRLCCVDIQYIRSVNLASSSYCCFLYSFRNNFVNEHSPNEAMEVSCDHRVVKEEKVARVEATLDVPLTDGKMSRYFQPVSVKLGVAYIEPVLFAMNCSTKSVDQFDDG